MFTRDAGRRGQRWDPRLAGHAGRRHHFDPDDLRGPDAFGRHMPGQQGGHGMRRGEIRPLILATLRVRPMHGYEIIQELEAQSGGRWRPSAGSVYPTLQQLADEGLVTSEEVGGRRTYTLTDDGRSAADEAPARGPWAGLRGPGNLRMAGMQLVGAAAQVQRIGSEGAQREAMRILDEARRDLYRLLADDRTDTAASDAGPGAPVPHPLEDSSAAE
jgi:DNA-binding PadR family transcriptional regulator